MKKEKQIKRPTQINELETSISQKKMYSLFSNAQEFKDNDYDSETDEEFLIKFDEELNFKKDVNGVDLCFLLDCTGSMNPYFKGIKLFIRKTIRDARRCMTQYSFSSDDMLRVSLVCYRDHPPQGKSGDLFTIPFTHVIDDFKKVLKGINAVGGGDDAEAVIDGLDEVVNNLTWREDSEKFVFHILDAPPHGNEFGSDKDGFPDGCPCGKDYESILLKFREMNIDYTIIKLDKSIDKMIEVFSQYLEIDVFNHEFTKLVDKPIDQNS